MKDELRRKNPYLLRKLHSIPAGWLIELRAIIRWCWGINLALVMGKGFVEKVETPSTQCRATRAIIKLPDVSARRVAVSAQIVTSLNLKRQKNNNDWTALLYGIGGGGGLAGNPPPFVP
jgi:hypothetical protein